MQPKRLLTLALLWKPQYREAMPVRQVSYLLPELPRQQLHSV
jgi:hypothetical protein